MSDFANRVRKLQAAATSGTLEKDLGLGRYVLTGWLGDTNPNEPRVKMETIEVTAKGLTQAKQKYMKNFKNQLPKEALNLETGLVVILVESADAARTFPADTPPSTGVVKFWKPEGTGFIVCDGVDYFVHHSEISCDEDMFPSLQAGQTVNFIPSTRKDQAIACSVVPAE